MAFSIYKFTSNLSGKVYIGKTQQAPEKRKASHEYYALNGSQTIFHRALRKHGFDSFSFDLVCSALTEDAANELEKMFIAAFESTNRAKGYNMTQGGDGVSSELATKINNDRIRNGTNAWAGALGTALNKSRIDAGTHNFQGASGSQFAKKNAATLLLEGRHASQQEYTCPHCNKVGKGGGMKRYHFDNCKLKEE